MFGFCSYAVLFAVVAISVLDHKRSPGNMVMDSSSLAFAYIPNRDAVLTCPVVTIILSADIVTGYGGLINGYARCVLIVCCNVVSAVQFDTPNTLYNLLGEAASVCANPDTPEPILDPVLRCPLYVYTFIVSISGI